MDGKFAYNLVIGWCTLPSSPEPRAALLPRLRPTTQTNKLQIKRIRHRATPRLVRESTFQANNLIFEKLTHEPFVRGI